MAKTEKPVEPVTPIITNTPADPKVGPGANDWRDPNRKYADDDHSLNADLWRMARANEAHAKR